MTQVFEEACVGRGKNGQTIFGFSFECFRLIDTCSKNGLNSNVGELIIYNNGEGKGSDRHTSLVKDRVDGSKEKLRNNVDASLQSDLGLVLCSGRHFQISTIDLCDSYLNWFDAMPRCVLLLFHLDLMLLSWKKLKMWHGRTTDC